MSKRMIKMGLILVVLAASICFFPKSAFAAVKASDTQLYRLSILQGVVTCYEKYAKDSITVGDFAGNWRNVFEPGMFSTSSGASEVWITTHVGNSLNGNVFPSDTKDSDLSCKQLFEGYGSSASGLTSFKSMPNTLVGMGYVFASNTNVQDANTGTANATSDQVRPVISRITDESGSNSNSITVTNSLTCNGVQEGPVGLTKKYYWKITGCQGSIAEKDNENLLTITINGTEVTASSDHPDILAVNYGMSLNAIADDIKRSLSNIDRYNSAIAFTDYMEQSDFSMALKNAIVTGARIRYTEPQADITFVTSTPTSVDVNNNDSQYVPKTNKTTAAQIMLRNIGVESALPNRNVVFENGNPQGVSYFWSGDYIYSLYYKYLQNMRRDYSGITINNCGSSKPSGYSFKNTESTWCAINIDSTASAAPDQVLSVVKGSSLGKGTFKDVLDWLSNDGSYQYVTGYADSTYDDSASGNNAGVNGGTETAVDAGVECKEGSGVLGWILCPIIQAVSGIGQTLWENIIEVLLEVPAKEIFVDDGGTRMAWELIQNIANVLFIVLFAFVIFSQLTGVGIDNYGIKRLLPRLILVAILANLSFVICELAIDASNIVGVGAKGIFTTAALNIPSSGNDTGVFVGGLAVDIGIGAGAAGIFAALNSLGLVGIPVAVGLAAIGLVISLVAGIIVLYLILVIREAGIVLMVAIAPIAIVCYALPNTEKLFKRWLSIMEALLVVYPLCSLAIGAGALASRALGTVDNGGMKLASMIVQVLPFFFIPMLLKNSLAGLGNVGAKLSAAGRSIGKRAGGALTGGIKNSERFKDFQQFQKDKTAAARADKVVKSLSGRTELTKRQRDRLNKAYMAQAARDRREREAEIGSDAEFQAIRMKNQEAAFAGEREKMYDRNFEFESDRGVIESSFIRSLSGNDGEYAASALKALINRGGITEAMNALQKDGVWEGMNDSVQQKLIQAMGATNVDAFKAFSKYRGSAGKAGIGFNRWMAGDAKDSGFKAASYGSYLSENGYGALNNVSKDEMQFVERNFDAIRSTMSDPTELTGMLASAAVNSKDAKVQTVAEATLQKQISSGQMNIADMGLTADMIGSMRGSMAQSMAMGLVEKNAAMAQQIRASVAAQNPGLAGVELEKAQNAALLAEGQNLLRQELAPQIEAIKSDVRIKNRTTGQVLDILGIERGNGGGNVADTSVQIQQRPGFGATQTPSSQNDSWYNRYSGGGNPLNPPNPPSPPNGQA